MQMFLHVRGQGGRGVFVFLVCVYFVSFLPHGTLNSVSKRNKEENGWMSFPCTFKNNNHLLSASAGPGAQLKLFSYVAHWILSSAPRGGFCHHLSFPMRKSEAWRSSVALPQGPTKRNWWSQGLTWTPELFLTWPHTLSAGRLPSTL